MDEYINVPKNLTKFKMDEPTYNMIMAFQKEYHDLNNGSGNMAFVIAWDAAMKAYEETKNEKK